MNKKHIPNTTLICIDGNKNSDIKKAIDKTLSICSFDDCIEVFDEKINSVKEYNDYILYKLIDLNIKTSHILIIQSDGWVVNPDIWSDEWLKYDYIGAPWALDPSHRLQGFPNVTSKNNVGNGGFSLRSMKLFNSIQKFLNKNNSFTYPEDAFICRLLRPYLEKEGIVFATQEVASKFSVENTLYSGQFGFHGKVTMRINGFTL